ncbi:MAG: DUF4351 domain-containing protein [Lautropia sp.]|nr:DUF4351 domain-containing protein [Lautropia sp.]
MRHEQAQTLILLRLLRRCFGELSPSMLQRIRAATPAQLEAGQEVGRRLVGGRI